MLDRAEFADALNSLDIKVSEADFDSLYRMLDEDGNGAISLKELQNSLHWVKSCEKCELLRNAAFLYDGTLSIPTQIRRALAAHSVRVMDLFREWDENCDGVLSSDEFLRAMPLLGIHAGKTEIDELFHSMDSDGDGIVTFKEFHRLLRKENDEVIAESLNDPYGKTSTDWRPKSPVVLVADVSGLRENIKVENRLRGLETSDIKTTLDNKEQALLRAKGEGGKKVKLKSVAITSILQKPLHLLNDDRESGEGSP